MLLDVDMSVDVQHRNDPNGACVDETGYGGVGPVVFEKILREEERHLDRHDLARVVGAHDENLGLSLVDAHVVRNLDPHDGAPEETRPDRIDTRAGWVGERERIEERSHLRVRMVLSEVLVERRRGREVERIENGDERAVRIDPGELVVCNDEIRVSVPIDVEDFDAAIEDRPPGDLPVELRASDLRNVPGLPAPCPGRADGDGTDREEDTDSLSHR
jgi:hypothetical protein